MPTNKKSISLNAYDKNGNLIGEFDGEFVYSNKDGSLLPFRVDGDEIYTQDSTVLLGYFSNGKALRLDNTILFQCD